MSKGTLVFAYGRFQPPTRGHELLYEKVRYTAEDYGGDPLILISHSRDYKRNPLEVVQKKIMMERAFPNVEIAMTSPASPSFLKYLGTKQDKYSHIIMVAGSDRVSGHRAVLNQYNHKEYTFDKIEVISAGERDPEHRGVMGLSGTKMREFVEKDDFASFALGLPHRLSLDDAHNLFNMVRRGLRME